MKPFEALTHGKSNSCNLQPVIAAAFWLSDGISVALHAECVTQLITSATSTSRTHTECRAEAPIRPQPRTNADMSAPVAPSLFGSLLPDPDRTSDRASERSTYSDDVSNFGDDASIDSGRDACGELGGASRVVVAIIVFGAVANVILDP